MSCLTKVRAAMDAMTASERKLASLVLSDPQKVLSASAKAIGESCGTSAASVVRFARMLGFSSIREMKDDLRMDVSQSAGADQQLDINFGDTLEHIMPRLFSQVISGMRSTLAMQNFEDMKRAVNLLERAETLYLYGIGASSLPALDLQQKLVRVNKRAIYREDHDLGILDSLYMTQKDVLVAFSYSGRTPEVNIAVRNAVQRGVECIAITKFGRSPLASLASITLPLPENEKEVRHAAVQSKYATFLLVDLLFIGYLQNCQGNAREQFEATRAMIRQLKEKNE